MKRLSCEEKEKFRDNMLSYLLFGEQLLKSEVMPAETLKGITDEERELIKKLAAQTDELYRIMNKNCNPEE